MIAYREAPRPRLRNVRTAKGATQRRVSHASRARYSGIFNFCVILFVALVGMMSYLMLTANLTSLNYAVARGEHQRTALLAETGSLDNRLAELRSDQRLAALAAQLGMRDPQRFAVVALKAPPQDDRSRLAFLSTITGWFTK